MSREKKLPWNNIKDGLQEALQYMQGRQQGKIKSLQTPWPKFNDAGIDGLEWNTTTIIGGRPGTGKSLLKDQIIREGFKLNSTEDFRVLDVSLEMHPRVTAIREFSGTIGRSYKYLLSAENKGKVTDADLLKCYDYAKSRKDVPVNIISTPCTITQFREYVQQYMETYSKPINNINTLTKTLITIDHSLLFKLDAFEKNKMEMINNLGEALTDLKRKYPIAFIVLSQLNRNVESHERNEDGKFSNYITGADFFGSDALLQHADLQVGINKPANQKIRFYGPERYIIEDEKVLVFHFLKCRNGDTRMSFFRAQFAEMRIEEMETPPQQEFKKK